MKWASKKLLNRDYFMELKMSQGYDLHEAHELWFKREALKRLRAQMSVEFNRKEAALHQDHKNAYTKYPHHFEGQGIRTKKGVGF